MADRFPLIVNAVSQKIEELISGDNLELSGNNIVISGDTGSGKYLTSNGTVVSWGCLLYTSPSPRDTAISRMPSSA